MRSKSVCFSGHRAVPEEEKQAIYDELLRLIRELILKGCTEFYAGGAVGFDMMAEEAVLQLKGEFPKIHLHLKIPYRGHNKYWSDIDKEDFEKILQCADSTEYLYEKYTKWSFFERNKKMVDSASLLICYLRENKGGTFRTVKYAMENNIEVVNILK